MYVGQALKQKFQLVFVQTLVALTTKVMADILIELLAQQLVLAFQLEVFLRHSGVLRLQRGDTRTQFFELFEQHRVGHGSLTRA